MHGAVEPHEMRIDGPDESAADVVEADLPPAPKPPGDLPPLPSKFYRAPPPVAVCKRCDRRFATADELNEHTRQRHRQALGKA
jgi:hypothetical protein